MSTESFPSVRSRRLRYHPLTRELVAETRLSMNDIIYPVFVCPGENVRTPIVTMPGQYRWSVDLLVNNTREWMKTGLKALILFGIPTHKDEIGSESCDAESPVQRAVKALKDAFGNDLLIVTDVCLCEYTSHGHCGVIKDNDVDNDPTLALLTRAAVSHAEAGADWVAPSDMMDGRVAAIRAGLDAAGFTKTVILSYAVKYSSAFYGPFRDAADSAPAFGDRRTYQLDYRNVREGLREAELDIQEGADIVMVKPALPYLDMIHRVRELTRLPVAAYCVSGEYSAIKAAAEKGWLDEDRVVVEALTCIKRAGADLILTYWGNVLGKLL